MPAPRDRLKITTALRGSARKLGADWALVPKLISAL
jgi:hypothetical protein